MRKKIFSAALVCFLLCASALTLFACGGGGQKANVYDQASELFETIDGDMTEGGMFSTHEVDGVQSDYSLTVYWNHAQYNVLNKLFIIPMNYLKNYYPDLQDLQLPEVEIGSAGQKAIDDFADGLADLKEGYLKCLNDYETYKNIVNQKEDSQVPQEGALAIYNLPLKQMFAGVYKAANALAQIKDNVFDDFSGLEVTNKRLNDNDVAQLRDYFVLSMANDLYRVLVVNMNMQDFSGASNSQGVNAFTSLKNSLKSRLTELMRLQALSTFQDLTGHANLASDHSTIIDYTNTKVSNLLELQSSMNGERQLLNKVLEKFSLKKFYEDYTCSFEAYSNVLTYAEQYFQEICDYFENYAREYVSYMTQHLQPGE